MKQPKRDIGKGVMNRSSRWSCSRGFCLEAQGWLYVVFVLSGFGRLIVCSIKATENGAAIEEKGRQEGTCKVLGKPNSIIRRRPLPRLVNVNV